MRARALQFEAVAKKDRQIVIRIEADMGERIDAFTVQLRAQAGVSVSSGEAVRKLITMGLDAAAAQKSKRRKGA